VYALSYSPFIDDSKLWDTYTGDALQTFSHEHIVRSVDISSSQHLLASGGHEKRLRLFDLQHGGKSRDIGHHDGTIKSVVWSRSDVNDNIIVTSADDKRIVWWDTRSSVPATEYATDSMTTSMERSVDGKSIVVTGGNTVLFFDSARYLPDLPLVITCSFV
jgi:serine-threonine kinase receptor-associated protein